VALNYNPPESGLSISPEPIGRIADFAIMTITMVYARRLRRLANAIRRAVA
jgi:hypothetical protein